MIFFAEKNIRGAWVVYGSEGVKHYYGYSKAEAMKLYEKQARTIVRMPEKKRRKKG